MKFTQTTIGAADYEKLADFYQNVFGFEEIARYDKPELGLKAIKLSGNGTILEISQATDFPEVVINFSYHKQGLQMVAIEVDDMNSAIDLIRKYGGRLSEGPHIGTSVMSIAFVVDPEGNGIELIETRSGVLQAINIAPWDRSKIWSTGSKSSDMNIFIMAASQNFWGYKVDEQTIKLGIRKFADSCGCPIPDKVADKLGASRAAQYFSSLIDDYNLVKRIAIQRKVIWASQWGAVTKRLSGEPAGEDSDGIPDEIIASEILGGPGNYHEFMVTRLLWENKINKHGLLLSQDKLTELIVSSKTLEDFHVNLLLEMGKSAISSVERREAEELLLKGLCHDGYLRQNNNATEIYRMIELVESREPKEEWMDGIISKAIKVLESNKKYKF